MIHEVNLPRRG